MCRMKGYTVNLLLASIDNEITFEKELENEIIVKGFTCSICFNSM